MKWNAAYVNSLPASSFAYYDSAAKKGHLPYKDKDGKVDLPHLRNALARLDQTDIPAAAKAAARKKLESAAKKAGVGPAATKKGMGEAVAGDGIFAIGDRVRVTGAAHAEAPSGDGVIRELNGNAVGIEFDSAPGSVYHWYTTDEIEHVTTDDGGDVEDEAPAAASKSDSFEEISAKVNAALKALLGDPWGPGATYWTVRATFDDAVVVEVAGDLKRYPLTFGQDSVTLGTPEDVEVVYQGMKEWREWQGHAILGPILEEGESKPGSKWAVVVITAGLSKNRTYYPTEVLREATELYEGAKVFVNHAKVPAGEMAMRNPLEIGGFLTNAKFAMQEGVGERGAVLATFTATSAKVRELLLEAHEAGKPDLVGLSHSVQAEVERVKLADGPATRVKRIAAVESVDIVSFPSAGGRVARLVAGMESPVPVTEEDLVMFEKKLQSLREGAPDLAKFLSAQPTETEIDALIKVMEARKVAATAAPAAAASAPAAPAAPAAAAAVAAGSPTTLLDEAAQKRLLQLEHRFTVDSLLEGRTMPEPMKVSLRESLLARVGENEVALKAEVDRFVTLAAKLAETGAAGSGLGRGSVEVDKDQAQKLTEALDDFFLQTPADNAAEIRKTYESKYGRKPGSGVRSFRELYVEITGDRGFTGLLENAQGLRRFARIGEGVSLMESMTTSSWPKILGDSIRRALLADYATINFLDQWRVVASDIGTIQDFRTNRRMRLGGYGDLPAVSEAGSYQPMTSPGDEEATYSISKKGGMETVTLEQIANDDVGAIRRIPMQLSRAAKRTLYKAVFDLLAKNLNYSIDSTALAIAGHNNLMSGTNLSASAISTARQKLANQTAFGGNDKLNLFPKTLVVPPDLEEIAWRLVNVQVANVSNQNATEASFQRALGLNQYVVYPYGDASFANGAGSRYWVVADPSEIPTIEVGFYQGRQEPELFTQDQPNVGSLFTADKIDYKIRFIFGVLVLDFRGFVGGNY